MSAKLVCDWYTSKKSGMCLVFVKKMGLGMCLVYESHYSLVLSKMDRKTSVMPVSGWYMSDHLVYVWHMWIKRRFGICMVCESHSTLKFLKMMVYDMVYKKLVIWMLYDPKKAVWSCIPNIFCCDMHGK